MIPVELVLLLINELKNAGLEMVAAPAVRDAFAFGEAAGWIKCTTVFEERLNSIIEDRAEPEDRPFDTTGSDEVEYRF